jgi:hypothetical protein
MALDVRTKRVYDEAESGDGHRVLIDHVWPRGISRERARLDEWARELAPSDKAELRVSCLPACKVLAVDHVGFGARREDQRQGSIRAGREGRLDQRPYRRHARPAPSPATPARPRAAGFRRCCQCSTKTWAIPMCSSPAHQGLCLHVRPPPTASGRSARACTQRCSSSNRNRGRARRRTPRTEGEEDGSWRQAADLHKDRR